MVGADLYYKAEVIRQLNTGVKIMSYFYRVDDREMCRCKRRIEKIFWGVHSLTAEVAVTPEPVPFAKRKDLSYKPIKEVSFGARNGTADGFI